MVNAPELSLRGGRRPTWQSPATGCVFAEAFLLFTIVLRDSHVALLLGMTNLEPLRLKIHAAIIASLQGAQGTPLQTQSACAFLSLPCTSCKCLTPHFTRILRPAGGKNTALSGKTHIFPHVLRPKRRTMGGKPAKRITSQEKPTNAPEIFRDS